MNMIFQHGNVLHAAVVSDVGCQRPNNEDNYLLAGVYIQDTEEHSAYSARLTLNKDNEWFIAGVFDGMGGGEKGEWASRAAVRAVRDAVGYPVPPWTAPEIEDRIRMGFLEANRRIVREREHAAVFGTTGTVLCTNGHTFRIFHLGDSRAYLFRDGCLYQLTRDQTLAAMKIEAGFYNADDPAVAFDKHRLTEYIGCDPASEGLRPLESDPIPWQNGDRVLLCSDGLYDMCGDARIQDIVSKSAAPDSICQMLVQAACEAGGDDNITCLLVQPESKSQEPLRDKRKW